MADAGKILIVDDDEDILVAGKLLLKRHYEAVITTTKPEDIPSLMAEHHFDAILLDMNFGPGQSSGAEGKHWLSEIMTIDPEAVVVMITAHGGLDLAISAMKIGATDFIAKPWQNEKLLATLSASVKLRQTRHKAETLRQTSKALSQAQTASYSIIGNSPQMQQVMSLVERAAPTDANVLILGENGTGKELIAREVHARSLRSDAIFMSVDLGSISENLFESELFGHRKGAFTGANETRVGKLQMANGGTLFLDEIGNLPLHLQSKLLTVLEQRSVTPVGDTKPVAIDVRVIAATNLAQDKLQNEAVFRPDLLFRLNTVEIHLPPLRDRSGDIVEIAKFYIQQYGKKYQRETLQLSDQAEAAMMSHAWPGNVRALRHAVERAIILSQNDVLQPQDFELSSTANQSTQNAATPSGAGSLPQSSSIGAEIQEDLNLERLERSAIETALKKHRYNISHTAKELGLTRAALYRRMEKHGL